MMTLFVLTEVEIYVMLAVVAAAVVALCVRPSAKGEARQVLLAGILCSDVDRQVDNTQPEVDFQCLNDGNVLLTRRGFPTPAPLTDAGAVSLAITVIGFDITIEERITTAPGGEPIDTALFTLDFLGQERYHIKYNSDILGRFVAFTLSNRPEMHIQKILRLNA